MKILVALLIATGLTTVGGHDRPRDLQHRRRARHRHRARCCWWRCSSCTFATARKLTKLVVVGGLLWLAILLLLTMTDFATRGILGVPGK